MQPRGHALSGIGWKLSLTLRAGLAAATPPLQPGLHEAPAHYRASSWTTEQGLPQNTVTALLQSRNGYLWIGTRYGLARFDGVRMTLFVEPISQLRPESLGIRGIVEDPSGALWISSWTNLLSWEHGAWSVAQLDQAPFPGRIEHVSLAADGGLWILKATGLFHFDHGRIGTTRSLQEIAPGFFPKMAQLERAFTDRQGRLWVLTGVHEGRRSVWHRIIPDQPGTYPLTRLLDIETDDIEALTEDAAGRLWAGRPGELIMWDGIPHHYAATSAWGGDRVSQIAVDHDGIVWVRSRGSAQLHRFDGVEFRTFGGRDGVLGSDDLRCLLPDREGNLWMGTGARGLCRLQPRRLVSLLVGAASAMDEVFSVAPSRDGSAWLATSHGLVNCRAGVFTVHTNHLELGEIGNVMRVRPAFEDRSGQVWFGLDHNGLGTLQDGEMALPAFGSIQSEERRRVTSILQDRAGTLWVTTPEGLLEHHPGRTRRWTQQDGLASRHLSGLAEGPDGTLWIGSREGGLQRFRDGQFSALTVQDGLLSQEVWPLHAEPDGTLWVGTPLGLNRIRGKQIRSVTQDQGLFDNIAYCLLEDQEQRYWSFCNRGIWRVRRSDLHAVADGRMQVLSCVNYGEEDGMASAEGNGDQQPNAALMPDGKLWFPTTRGVVIVDPQKVRDNNVPPGAIIEEVQIDQECVYRDGRIGNSTPPSITPASQAGRENGNSPGARDSSTAALRLGPGRARLLEIRYTGTTFVDPEFARFRYRLLGHEEAWQEARARRVALYTNLRPGTYTFELEACNRHGCWSRRPATFSFSLAPHVYETWLFRVGCLTAMAAALLGWYLRRRHLQDLRQRLEKEHALQEERGRIAKDLHDDLGANLTGLAMQLEAAQEHAHDPETMLPELANGARSARSMVTQMREVIWSINPQCDTLESFCAFASDFAERFLQTAGLRCRLDLPIDVPPRELAAGTRYHLVLVVKEALHNAAKHANASEVRLSLTIHPDAMVLVISDDGMGFPPGHDLGLRTDTPDLGRPSEGSLPQPPGIGGRGIRNMRRRVEAMHGALRIETQPAAGTKVIVQIPLRRSS